MPTQRDAVRAACAATLLLALASAVADPAPVESPMPKRKPSCTATQHRQFDFWIGAWDVFTADGKKAGESRIEPIADGCALLEHWTGNGNVTGKSLNIYTADDGRWHQTWVDNSGSLLVIAGGFVDGKMVMTSDPALPGAGQRITWTPNEGGSVRQLWESSTDSGKTWTVQFDGRYVRRN